jgi:pSer/pThr/pTyr-binding forkhead associated (FHA) protein
VNAQFFLEVLARNGEVKYRQRVESLPIRIGRAYDNDFIIDDRHTSPHHAVVELGQDGVMEVRDLGSRNGVIHKGRRQIQMPIDGNTIFRLGHTNIRIRSTDFPVADEMADTTLHNWEGWPPALTGLLLLLLLTLASVWSSDIERSGTIRYFTALAVMLGFALLWCGSWSLANRLFEGQMRFGRHLFIVACGLITIELTSILYSITAYAFSFETLTHYGNHAVVAVVAGVVYFHLLTINPGNTRRFVWVAIILLFLGSGMTLMVNYQTRGYFADELYMGELLPPSLRLSSDKPVANLLANAAKMKARVDVERSKEVSVVGEAGDNQD